jgi:hypothetical protein
MSKTHRRLSHLSDGPAAAGRRPGSLVALLAATGGRRADRFAPFARPEREPQHRLARDHEFRIELQSLFDDEPEDSADTCDDVWALMGLDRNALCTGGDGLVRLTVA